MKGYSMMDLWQDSSVSCLHVSSRCRHVALEHTHQIPGWVSVASLVPTPLCCGMPGAQRQNACEAKWCDESHRQQEMTDLKQADHSAVVAGAEVCDTNHVVAEVRFRCMTVQWRWRPLLINFSRWDAIMSHVNKGAQVAPEQLFISNKARSAPMSY